jgi:hypothetical protein
MRGLETAWGFKGAERPPLLCAGKAWRGSGRHAPSRRAGVRASRRHACPCERARAWKGATETSEADARKRRDACTLTRTSVDGQASVRGETGAPWGASARLECVSPGHARSVSGARAGGDRQTARKRSVGADRGGNRGWRASLTRAQRTRRGRPSGCEDGRRRGSGGARPEGPRNHFRASRERQRRLPEQWWRARTKSAQRVYARSSRGRRPRAQRFFQEPQLRYFEK